MNDNDATIQTLLAYIALARGGRLVVNVPKLIELQRLGYTLTWEVDALGALGTLTVERAVVVIDGEAKEAPIGVEARSISG